MKRTIEVAFDEDDFLSMGDASTCTGIIARSIADNFGSVGVTVNIYDTDDCIKIGWTAQDVLSLDSSLTLEQAREILQNIEENHDAEIGVNWSVISEEIERWHSGFEEVNLGL